MFSICRSPSSETQNFETILLPFFKPCFWSNFWKAFCSFLPKKWKTWKRAKVCFVLVFTIYRKGQHFEKSVVLICSSATQNTLFGWKSGPNWLEKRRQPCWDQQSTKKRSWKRTLDRTMRVGVDFGVPGGPPKKPLGKKKSSQETKRKTSRGSRMPRRKTRTRTRLFRAAFWASGKEDPARLCPPGDRWAGGLFTLRASRRGAEMHGGMEIFEDWRGITYFSTVWSDLLSHTHAS